MPLVLAEGDRWLFAASTIQDGPANSPDGEDCFDELLLRMQTVFGGLLPSARSFHVARLCHGDRVAVVGSSESALYDETDGLMTEVPGVVLRVTGADCLPVFLLDQKDGRIALVHAGRKGTVKNIAGKAVQRMVASGSDPRQMIAIIGPGVCAHHYLMPPEILAEFSEYPEAIHDSGLSLRRVISTQLVNEGLLDANIQNIDECTFEMPEKWFSYRRDTGEGFTSKRPRVQAFVATMKG